MYLSIPFIHQGQLLTLDDTFLTMSLLKIDTLQGKGIHPPIRVSVGVGVRVSREMSLHPPPTNTDEEHISEATTHATEAERVRSRIELHL